MARAGDDELPGYSAAAPPTTLSTGANHTNPFIEAANLRAIDEQEMQQALLNLQYSLRIYNTDIEPEHETDLICHCPVHQYQRRKLTRLRVQAVWGKAVLYPGEKPYHDFPVPTITHLNPYRWQITSSPYGRYQGGFIWTDQRPIASCYTAYIRDVLALNNKLNAQAQQRADANEPKEIIWGEEDDPSTKKDLKGHQEDASYSAKDSAAGEKKSSSNTSGDQEGQLSSTASHDKPTRSNKNEKHKSKFSISKIFGLKTPEEKVNELKQAIIQEENGRWPDEEWRRIVRNYQAKVGMRNKILHLRLRYPVQYLHLLRAGYFEPIPVAWAVQASNPMKFAIEAQGGWRGITPSWRGYEDLAEERLYWVINHREGSTGTRIKPDFVSAMRMAQERMLQAVEPPPLYYSSGDTCQTQHTSEKGTYSRQVLPTPADYSDQPIAPTDDTMILLDVSGSMDFDPARPLYDEYLITGYQYTHQPKNKDVARAIIRRFTDALSNHDHLDLHSGYDLVTFSDQAKYVGKVNHQTLPRLWDTVRYGGLTRVMTGWQMVKDLHFRKHAASATYHPVYGWQAGPETPKLRLLLLLDGEANDMDEFELDLLGLSWAHITIFLIGVDGCPHHHRHANELQRISEMNTHVSFVDAQGNFPERFVTHELLKRHLGYDVSMQEFERMEELPAYSD